MPVFSNFIFYKNKIRYILSSNKTSNKALITIEKVKTIFSKIKYASF